MSIDDLNQCLPLAVQLNANQYHLLDQYLDELLLWNRKINLTAIRSKHQCWEKHIIDSLLLGEFIDSEKSLLDVGTGAGLPSIPLKILYDSLDVTSIDTVGKKIQFQKHCVRKLRLENFQAISGRIENLREYTDRKYLQITSRAFTSLGAFCQLCFPYLAEEGRLIAMKGAGFEREVDECGDLLAELNLRIVEIHQRTLRPSGEKRAFVVVENAGQGRECE